MVVFSVCVGFCGSWGGVGLMGFGWSVILGVMFFWVGYVKSVGVFWGGLEGLELGGNVDWEC